MLDTKITFHQGQLFWEPENPLFSIRKIGAFWSTASGGFNNLPKDFTFDDFCNANHSNGLDRQSSSFHARSVYLGKDNLGSHYFAKGTGWIQSSYWMPEYPTVGILPKWAAIREKDLAQILKSNNLDCVSPVGIILHSEIPVKSLDVKYLKSDAILDMDGSPANPAIYIYSAPSRWRLADLAYLPTTYLQDIIPDGSNRVSWVISLIKKITRFSAILHKVGGHDYSLSSHNVFLDGTRVDFEYLYHPNLLHQEAILNSNIVEWQRKELFALRSMIWEFSELMRVDLSIAQITELISTTYRNESNFLQISF